MRTLLFLISSLVVAVAPASVSAQRPVHVGVSAGLTPSLAGSFDQGYRGAHIQAALEFTPANNRFGLRLDGFTHDLSRAGHPNLSNRTEIIGGTASALVGLGPLHRSLAPYLLAGSGTYRTEYGEPAPEWHFGIAVGGGVRYQTGPVAVFAEARLHQIMDGSTPRLVPVSFGIRF